MTKIEENNVKKNKTEKRKRIMIILGIVLVIIGGILIYWNIPYSPFKSAFIKKMKNKAEQIPVSEEAMTQEKIAKLPVPLQKYCKYIGLENYPKYQAVRVNFNHTDFVFDSKTGKTIDMDYDLWLFNDRPYRSAFCTSSIGGVPFDGIDYCSEDKLGGMKGIFGKAVQIFDVKNEQGYKAILISWIAESVVYNPSVLISDYVTYETIDDLHVKATVSDQGISGSGIFTFNEEGAIIEFYSDERQMEEVDGEQRFVGWRCDYLDYGNVDGIRQIQKINCVKIFPDREFSYFASDDFKVTYRR